MDARTHQGLCSCHCNNGCSAAPLCHQSWAVTSPYMMCVCVNIVVGSVCYAGRLLELIRPVCFRSRLCLLCVCVCVCSSLKICGVTSSSNQDSSAIVPLRVGWILSLPHSFWFRCLETRRYDEGVNTTTTIPVYFLYYTTTYIPYIFIYIPYL